MPREVKKALQSGETQYFKTCIACHGADGKGVQIAGTDMALAPSLVDSKRVHGDPEKLIPVFLHGLTGPIEGKNYQAGFMAPAAALGVTREDRLSEIISYIRYAWGGENAEYRYQRRCDNRQAETQRTNHSVDRRRIAVAL